MLSPLSSSKISAFRLRRHHFADRARVEVSAVCRDVCGIQAQVMSAAHIALWARMHHLTRAEIDAALYRDRTLVKTNCMRATLHFLDSADYPFYVAALKRSRIRQAQAVMARWGVTQREAVAAGEASLEALAAGPMTRRDIREQVIQRIKLGKKARSCFEKSWWGTVHQAIVEGLVCYGEERGRDITLVRVDQWLPKFNQVPEAEGLQFLLRRYLGAFGPATLRDFARWAGISAAEVKVAGDELKDEMMEVIADGKTALILKNDYDQLRRSKIEDHHVRLLPNFDAYLLAHAQKDHLVSSQFYKRVYRNQGWISAVVLLKGRVIGLWSIERKGKRSALQVEPFEIFTRAVRTGITEEAASLGQFLETFLEVEYKA
ncbi:MAG TPA: winged helix DNA-binding domain-containing protein [Terriglobia bacterium]|nr:winged helix DNA-binding domain-containing protein [Terriglobia bacterium]